MAKGSGLTERALNFASSVATLAVWLVALTTAVVAALFDFIRDESIPVQVLFYVGVAGTVLWLLTQLYLRVRLWQASHRTQTPPADGGSAASSGPSITQALVAAVTASHIHVDGSNVVIGGPSRLPEVPKEPIASSSQELLELASELRQLFDELGELNSSPTWQETSPEALQAWRTDPDKAIAERLQMTAELERQYRYRIFPRAIALAEEARLRGINDPVLDELLTYTPNVPTLERAGPRLGGLAEKVNRAAAAIAAKEGHGDGPNQS